MAQWRHLVVIMITIIMWVVGVKYGQHFYLIQVVHVVTHLVTDGWTLGQTT